MIFLPRHLVSYVVVPQHHFCAYVDIDCYVFLGSKVAVEGKVEHKFDMKPHNENFEEYGRLCRERTNKSMMKNRQIQVSRLLTTLLGFGL